MMDRRITHLLYKKHILFFIIVASIFSALCFGYIKGDLGKTEFSNYKGDAWTYNQTALRIVETGSIFNEEGTYYGSIRRGPGYPMVLAVAYAVWPHPAAALVLQLILFGFSILLVWEISQFFLSRALSLCVSGIFGISWFVATFVANINSDFIGMFFFLLFFWALLNFFILYKNLERNKLLTYYIIIAASALSFVVLARPIFIYFTLVVFLLLLFFRYFSYAILFLGIAAIVIAPWMYVSHVRFNTPQLVSGGYLLAWKAGDAALPKEKLVPYLVASIGGDVVAETLYPGHAEDPEPYERTKEVLTRRKALQERGVPENEIDKMFFQEALSDVRMHPGLFVVTSVSNFIKLHTIPNHEGLLMVRFLAENETAPTTIKIVSNVVLRLIWFGFVGLAFAGFVRYLIKEEELFIKLLLLVSVGYIVGIHSLFVHAEFRFILPIIPLYIIFALYMLNPLFSRFYSYRT